MIAGIANVQNKELVDLRINDSMDSLDAARTLANDPTLGGLTTSVTSLHDAVQPALDATENTLNSIPDFGNTYFFD